MAKRRTRRTESVYAIAVKAALRCIRERRKIPSQTRACIRQGIERGKLKRSTWTRQWTKAVEEQERGRRHA